MVVERTAALRQRDLLLREVYHREKNNLQIIDGMVMMQSRQLQDQARSDEHTCGLQSLMRNSYAGFSFEQTKRDYRHVQRAHISHYCRPLCTYTPEFDRPGI